MLEGKVVSLDRKSASFIDKIKDRNQNYTTRDVTEKWTVTPVVYNMNLRLQGNLVWKTWSRLYALLKF